MTKAAPEFYLTNFVAFAATGTDPTVPCTEFANGAPIKLSWESNGTSFKITMKDGTEVYAGSETHCMLEDGVATDTTFLLVASMTGNPSRHEDPASSEAFHLYDTLTVTIFNPDLRPRTVVTRGDFATGGTLAVQGVASVTGQSMLGAVEAGSIQVSGSTTLGATNVVSALSAPGAVAMLSGAQRLATTSFQAPTDGFCLGVIVGSGPYTQISAQSSDGAAPCLMASGEYPQSLCLPVKSGAHVTCGASGNAQSYAFYWVPFGTSSSPGLQPLQRTDDAVKPPHLAAASAAKIAEHSKEAILDELIDIIGLLAAKPLPAEARERLAGVLRMANVGW